MKSYIRLVLRFRFAVILILLGITVFFGYHFSKVRVSSTPGEIFFPNNPKYERYQERMAVYGGDNLAVIGLEGENLVSRDNLEKLRRISDGIEENEFVNRVDSLLTAQHIRGLGDELLISDYADLFMDEPERREELLADLTSDPLTRDWLITGDARNLIVVVELSAGDRAMEASRTVMEDIFNRFRQEGFNPELLHRGGLAGIMGGMMNEAIKSLNQLLPITAFVLFMAVWLMFRRFWPVILTLIITGMAVIWTMGLAVFLYGHINILTTMVPSLVLITCFADVVHLCSAYLLEISLGRSREEAILSVGGEVGAACGYTSITTFFGFVSMALVPVPIFKQLGLLMGFGVSAGLFMALTLVPVFLSFIPKPKPWRTGSTSRIQGALDRVLEWTSGFTARHPKKIIASFTVLFCACTVGAFYVHFEARFTERFSEDHPIQTSMDYFNESFPGINPLDIYLDVDLNEGFLDPELFSEIADFEAWAESLPKVSQVVSVADLVRKMYKEINPEMAAESPLPRTREGLAQLLLLFEMSGGEDLERFINYEHSTMHLNARLHDMGVIETRRIAEQIIGEAQRRFGNKVKAEAMSMASLTGEWVDNIIRGQRNGLLVALLTVAIMMIIAMRSFGIGLISMLPNTLPLLTLLGYTGLFWDILDTDALGVLMVAIGIGVDDTIHFLMRLKFEFSRTPDVKRAVNRTLHYSGRAIIMTTVILVGGFAPFFLSDYFSVHIFGSLLPACLIVALLADLFWVPALVHTGMIRFK